MRSTLLASAVALALFQPLFARADALPNGVASGDPHARGAVLLARAGQPGTLTFEVAADASFARILRSHVAPVADATQPVKWAVNGLRSGRTYHFRATDNLGNMSAGQFTTPFEDGKHGLRFGVTGDWRGELAPYPAVSNIPARGLGFLVALGDTIYAENYDDPAVPTASTLIEYRAKYDQTRSAKFGVNTWADVHAATPLFATIDDHEVINDFAGGAHPSTDDRFDATGSYINETHRYTDGLRAFQEYMPLQPQVYGATGDARTSGKPRLYRERQFGQDAAIFVLDARSFRDQELTLNNPLDPVEVGGFLYASFDASRTMLGRRQIDDLKAGLLRAREAGVSWKFVMVPEPIQNLGVVGAGDRFEGYAAERSEILRFVRDNDIRNVVFVAADIHGTLVNNLSYQDGLGQPQIAVNSWEISTGAVAFDAPFGPTVAGLAFALGLPGALDPAVYAVLPVAQQEGYIQAVVNSQVLALGYDAVGLDGSGIPATLLSGGYTATNSYGWTEFEIDANTQALTVTTWGVPAYTKTQMEADPATYATLVPAIVGQFRVDAQ
jgi:phosphodiesterase/alkaline phosphatase D-like protein